MKKDRDWAFTLLPRSPRVLHRTGDLQEKGNILEKNMKQKTLADRKEAKGPSNRDIGL